MDAVAHGWDMWCMSGLSRETRLVKGFNLASFCSAVWGPRLYKPGKPGISSIHSHVDKGWSGLVGDNLFAMHMNNSHHVRLVWDFAKSGVGLINFCEKAASNDDCEGYFSAMVRHVGGYKAPITDMSGVAVRTDLIQQIKYITNKGFIVPISKRKRYPEDDSRANYMHNWHDGSMHDPASEHYRDSFFKPLAKRMKAEASATTNMIRHAHQVRFTAAAPPKKEGTKKKKVEAKKNKKAKKHGS